MNPFDGGILTFLNGFARHSWTFDTFMSMLSENDFLKGGVITALLWWVWFRKGEGEEKRREFVLSGIFSCLLAIVAARILALTLPFRERPLRNPALHLSIPYGVNENLLIHWSSFPSDHAVLFFALATSIYFASRQVGLLAYFHVLIVICLPRLYLGIHYPSDILGGALLGIGIACLTRITAIRDSIAQPGMRWEESHPASFYASIFLATTQISELFGSVRQVARFIFEAMKPFLKLS